MPGQFSDEHGGEDGDNGDDDGRGGDDDGHDEENGDNGDDDCDKVDNSVFGHPDGVNDIRYAYGYENLERLSVVPEV